MAFGFGKNKKSDNNSQTPPNVFAQNNKQNPQQNRPQNRPQNQPQNSSQFPQNNQGARPTSAGRPNGSLNQGQGFPQNPQNPPTGMQQTVRIPRLNQPQNVPQNPQNSRPMQPNGQFPNSGPATSVIPPIRRQNPMQNPAVGQNVGQNAGHNGGQNVGQNGARPNGQENAQNRQNRNPQYPANGQFNPHPQNGAQNPPTRMQPTVRIPRPNQSQNVGQNSALNPRVASGQTRIIPAVRPNGFQNSPQNQASSSMPGNMSSNMSSNMSGQPRRNAPLPPPGQNSQNRQGQSPQAFAQNSSPRKRSLDDLMQDVKSFDRELSEINAKSAAKFDQIKRPTLKLPERDFEPERAVPAPAPSLTQPVPRPGNSQTNPHAQRQENAPAPRPGSIGSIAGSSSASFSAQTPSSAKLDDLLGDVELKLPPLTKERRKLAYDSMLDQDKQELAELKNSNFLDSADKPIKTRLYDYTHSQASCLRVGVVVFPGTLDDGDAARAVRLAGARPIPLWHQDQNLRNVDAIVIPGGFSYGDYLRCGAISALAPIMEKVKDAAKGGMPILGICNGFQILTEAHLLPGGLARNSGQKFICREQELIVANNETAWTNAFDSTEIIKIPLKNGEGRFVADKTTLNRLEAEGRIVFRYANSNPNGSMNDIAGICNEKGNVVGLMPHPEHAVESGFGVDNGDGATLAGGTDGLKFFQSLVAGILKGDLSGSN